MLEDRFIHEGGVIFDDGTSANEAFIVRSGRVEISKEIDGRWVILAHIEEGQIFGEIGVLRGHRTRTARAKASQPTTLVVIPRAVFDRLLNSLDKMSRQIVVSLAARVEATTKLKDFMRSEDPLRAFYELLKLLTSVGEGPLSATHVFKTFRRVLGVDRPACIDILSKMHTLNLIQVRPGPKRPETVEMVDLDRAEVSLRQLSQELGNRHFDFRQHRAEIVPFEVACEDDGIDERKLREAIASGQIAPSDIYVDRAGLSGLTGEEDGEGSE